MHTCMCHHLIGRGSKGSIESKYYSFSISILSCSEKRERVETKGTLSRIFPRGCSLSLGRPVSWNLFSFGGRSGKVWESASRKNRVARWKVSRWGFRPSSSSPTCGRGEVSWYSTLSLAPFFSLFLFVYSGRGRQLTYMKRRREGGFLEIKVSRRSKKATSGRNRCFGHSVDSLLPVRACCHAGKNRGFGRFYLLLDLNQWLSPYESDTLTTELSGSFILIGRIGFLNDSKSN